MIESLSTQYQNRKFELFICDRMPTLRYLAMESISAALIVGHSHKLEIFLRCIEPSKRYDRNKAELLGNATFSSIT